MKLFRKWEQNLLSRSKAREERLSPMGEYRPPACELLGFFGSGVLDEER